MAVSSPTGSATLMAIRVAISVPYTSGRTPKSPCGGAHRVEVRNSTGETSRKNREVSSKSTMTIPNVVKIERYAQEVRKTLMMRSLASLARLLRFQASAPDLVPSALAATWNPPKPREWKYGGRLPSLHPLCYKQTHSDTYGHCDCLSAVLRSPPLGSPSALYTVPVVRSSYCVRDSCSRLVGNVTYFAAFTSRSRFCFET